jgi:hypothetical protein
VAGIDYGVRKGTLGFAVHMAEGGDGTVAYLAKRASETVAQWHVRVRGVSANFVILSTGEVVQMVPWAHISGSMNPAARSDTAGFYRAEFIKQALGTHYTDPNAWSLSVEVTGYRAKGPTQAQVDALVTLIGEARRRYPQLVGAYGHADQTDTKGCPGTAPLMLGFWEAVGHGTFTEAPMRITVPLALTGSVKLLKAWGLWRVATDVKTDPLPVGTTWAALGSCRYHVTATDPDGKLGYLVAHKAELYVVPAESGVSAYTPDPLAEWANCTAAVKAATAPLNARIAGIKAKVAANAADVAND